MLSSEHLCYFLRVGDFVKVQPAGSEHQYASTDTRYVRRRRRDTRPSIDYATASRRGRKIFRDFSDTRGSSFLPR